MDNIVIIDTGCANVSSLRFAVERLGYPVTVSRDPDVVLAADKLFLPGVGTATEAMKNLRERDLIDLVKKIDKPVLGICLGMQLLGQDSAEGKDLVPCLGHVPAATRLMETGELPLPHMGWNQVTPKVTILFLKIYRRAAISILCTAMRCQQARTPLLLANTATHSVPQCKAVTITVCNSTRNAQVKPAHN